MDIIARAELYTRNQHGQDYNEFMTALMDMRTRAASKLVSKIDETVSEAVNADTEAVALLVKLTDAVNDDTGRLTVRGADVPVMVARRDAALEGLYRLIDVAAALVKE